MIVRLSALEYTWIRTGVKLAPPMPRNDPSLDGDFVRSEILRCMSIRKVVNTGFLGRRKMIEFDVWPFDIEVMQWAGHWYADNGPLSDQYAKLLHACSQRIYDGLIYSKFLDLDGYDREEPKAMKLSERDRDR